MFSLVKLQKLLGFEIYVGQMHCDGRMYYNCGSEEVMYLLILCDVFCPVVIIFLCVSFSYHLQMGRGVCVAMVLKQGHSHHVAEGI